MWKPLPRNPNPFLGNDGFALWKATALMINIFNTVKKHATSMKLMKNLKYGITPQAPLLMNWHVNLRNRHARIKC